MNIVQFAKKISKYSLDGKMEAAGKINKALGSGIGMDGNKLSPDQSKALERLSRWLLMNIMVGNELCPQ